MSSCLRHPVYDRVCLGWATPGRRRHTQIKSENKVGRIFSISCKNDGKIILKILSTAPTACTYFYHPLWTTLSLSNWRVSLPQKPTTLKVFIHQRKIALKFRFRGWKLRVRWKLTWNFDGWSSCDVIGIITHTPRGVGASAIECHKSVCLR